MQNLSSDIIVLLVNSLLVHLPFDKLVIYKITTSDEYKLPEELLGPIKCTDHEYRGSDEIFD
jgi:hypothetical protein